MTVTHTLAPRQRTSSENTRLTTAQAAAALGVSVRTVRRWADDGTLGSISTLGGHRRFRATEVVALALRLHEDRPHDVTARAVRNAAQVVDTRTEPAAPSSVPQD